MAKNRVSNVDIALVAALIGLWTLWSVVANLGVNENSTGGDGVIGGLLVTPAIIASVVLSILIFRRAKFKRRYFRILYYGIAIVPLVVMVTYLSTLG